MPKRKKKANFGVRLLKGSGVLMWKGLSATGKGISYLAKKGYQKYSERKLNRAEEKKQEKRSQRSRYDSLTVIKSLSGDLSGFDALLTRSSVGLVVGSFDPSQSI
mgnify:CR=1 FL=1